MCTGCSSPFDIDYKCTLATFTRANMARTDTGPATPKKTRAASSRSPKKQTLGTTGQPPRPTAASLDSSSRLTADQWYRSTNTTKTYAAYVKAGKKFLESWTKEDRETVTGESEGDGAGVPEFENAFDNIDEHTPTALRMLTAFKCDHEKKKFSTAEGIRSAFKSYFER